HCRFGFDPAYAPAKDAKAIDHRRVRIRSNQRIRIRDRLTVFLRDEDRLAEVLQVDLVADAGAGRHDTEVLEPVLAPAENNVALLVALELLFGVDEKRRLGSVFVDLHGVVDDEIDRLQRVDLLRAAAERFDRIAHRGEIDDGWDTSEVLQEYAARAEGDLFLF